MKRLRWVLIAGAAVGAYAYWQRERLAKPEIPFDPLAYILTPEDDADAMAARLLPLEGGLNFRDIGGYRAVDGARVRAGRVYRSGSLTALTDADLAQIETLGLRLICDLRTASEIAIHPDRVPTGAVYEHLPLYGDDESFKRLRALLFNRSQLPHLMTDAYTRVAITNNALVYGHLLRRIAYEDNLPLLIHCTAGKDRTGVAIALLLLLLGVPDDVVIADYTQSNRHYDDYHAYAAKAIERMASLGVTADHMRPLLVADAEIMREAIAYLREQYGDVTTYLREEAGVDDAMQARLRALLLENAA